MDKESILLGINNFLREDKSECLSNLVNDIINGVIPSQVIVEKDKIMYFSIESTDSREGYFIVLPLKDTAPEKMKRNLLRIPSELKKQGKDVIYNLQRFDPPALGFYWENPSIKLLGRNSVN